MEQWNDDDLVAAVAKVLRQKQITQRETMMLSVLKNRFEDPSITAITNLDLSVEILRYQGTIDDSLLAKYYAIIYNMEITEPSLQDGFWLDLLVAIIKRYLQFPKADWYLLRFFKAINYQFSLDQLNFAKEVVEDIFFLPTQRDPDYPDTISGLPKVRRVLEDQLVSVMPMKPSPTYVIAKPSTVTWDSIPRLTHLDTIPMFTSGLTVTERPHSVRDLVNNLSQASSEEMIKFIMQQTTAVQETDINLEQAMRQQLQSMDAERLRDFYLTLMIPGYYIPLVRSLQEDSSLFQLMGPVNNYNDLTINSVEDAYQHFQYGGTRMFTDLLSEYDPYEDEMKSNWFTGSCDQCYHRIQKYTHAVRRPLLLGGWRGCFCDFDCVRAWLERHFEDNDLSESEEALTYALVAQFEEDLNKHGIWDDSQGIIIQLLIQDGVRPSPEASTVAD